MIRNTLLSFLALMACTPLFAQADQAALDTASGDNSYETSAAAELVVVELSAERSLSVGNGIADLFDGVFADKLVLNYQLVNDTTQDMSLSPQVVISDEAFCAVEVTQLTDGSVAAGESTTMTIEVKPEHDGPFSFRVNMGVDDAEYTFEVQATVIALLHGDSHHCHWYGCHRHHTHDDHHCSTTSGAGWTLFAALGAALGLLAYRRTRKA